MAIPLKSFILVALIVMTAACSKKMAVKRPPLILDPKVKARTMSSSAKDLSNGWGSKAVALSSAWRKFSSSKAVKVAIIGSGVDYTHPDLYANMDVTVVKGKKRVGRDFVGRDYLAYDHFGSDTEVAGIIGAVHNGKGISGVMKQVTMTPIRYINGNGLAILPHMILSFQHALKTNPHVIYFNKVRPKSSRRNRVSKLWIKKLNQILKKLEAKGIPIVVGAGDSMKIISRSTDLVWNALLGHSNVVVVTSVDAKKRKPDLANFSATFVKTTAPGENVMTTVAGGSTALRSGSHLAAAYVAGAMAKAISNFKGQRSLQQLVNALLRPNASRQATNLGTIALGGNVLDVARYLSYINDHP